MLPVIYEGAEPRQSALLVLGLIPRLGALYQISSTVPVFGLRQL